MESQDPSVDDLPLWWVSRCPWAPRGAPHSTGSRKAHQENCSCWDQKCTDSCGQIKKQKRCKYKNFKKNYSFGKIINEKSFGSATNCGPSLVCRATFRIFTKISMSKCMPVLLHCSVTLSCIGIVDANTTQTCTDLAYNIQHTLPCMPCNIIWQMPFLHPDQLHKKLRGSGNSLWFSNKCL